jgi:hypothetical protein
MKTVVLREDRKEAAMKLKGKLPAPSHADLTIAEDTVLIAPDGSIIAVLLTHCISPELWQPAYRMWRKVRDLPENRATAVGSPSLPGLRTDGTLSGRQRVPKEVLDILKKEGVRQGMLGYVDATPDAPCRLTSLTIRHPEWIGENMELIELAEKFYALHVPSLYAIQRAEIEKAGCCRLGPTVFSTAYINKGMRCAYHRDSGNLKGVMSALMPMGHFIGGELVFPRWRRAIAFMPGDLLLFDPQQLHGNLPFEGKRLSAIFYCERRIAECGKQLIPRYPRTH